MTEEEFIRRGEPAWQAFAGDLVKLDAGRPAEQDFPVAYRAICHDLAVARERQLDVYLVDRLNRLALRGHQHLYRPAARPWRHLIDGCLTDLPRAVRAEWRMVVLAAALFYGGGAAVFGVVSAHPDLVYGVMSQPQIAELEATFDPASGHLLRPRDEQSNTMMFGFYVQNNIGIAFRTFATGIVFGAGSLFFLLYNGAMLGAALAHLLRLGFGTTFTSFVIGHGAFELQALILSGAAGLRLGWSVLAPGTLTRREALRLAARRSVRLILVAAGFLLLAACIEAYWSSNVAVNATTKYGVGLFLWAMVAAYVLFCGTRVYPDPKLESSAGIDSP